MTFFGGYEIMQTRDGLQQVIDKIAELKPSVSLWYRDEGQFQQGLEAGEYTAGAYHHDRAQTAEPAAPLVCSDTCSPVRKSRARFLTRT